MALEFGLGSVEWAPWSGTSWLCLLLVGLIYVSRGELRVKAHGKKVAAEGASPKAKSLEEPLIRAEQGYGATGPKAPAGGMVVAGIVLDADKVVEVMRVGVLCFWMVLCSMAIIYTNAWILDNMCPHAATLTAIQQGFGAVMAALCVFVFKLSEPVEGMSAGPYCKYILPLSLCFTVYLWGSNAAYIYLAPGFVQMIKPMGSAIVFLVATALGLEEYSHYKAVNFLLICAGIAVTAYSKFDGRPVTSGPGRPSADDGFACGELPVSWDDRPTSALPVVVMPRVSKTAHIEFSLEASGIGTASDEERRRGEALELRRLQKKLGLDDAAAAELNLQEALAALPPLEKRPRTAPKPRPRAANLRAPKRSAYYGPAHRGQRSPARGEPRSVASLRRELKESTHKAFLLSTAVTVDVGAAIGVVGTAPLASGKYHSAALYMQANGFDKLVKTVARMQQAKLHAAWNAWLERVRAHRRHLAEARYLRKHGAATMWTKIVEATRRLVKAKFGAWLELVFELRHVENAEAREAAAITMQRGTRGHAARQEMRRRRAGEDPARGGGDAAGDARAGRPRAGASLARAVVARERVDALYDARDRKRRRDDGAAAAIQTAARGRAARNEHGARLAVVLARRRAEHGGATAIARRIRGTLSRSRARKLRDDRVAAMIADARRCVEQWNDDEATFMYYDDKARTQEWEPPPSGYLRRDGLLVLTNGRICEDPDNVLGDAEKARNAAEAAAAHLLGLLSAQASQPLADLQSFLAERLALENGDIRTVQDERFDDACVTLESLSNELHYAGRLGKPGAKPPLRLTEGAAKASADDAAPRVGVLAALAAQEERASEKKKEAAQESDAEEAAAAADEAAPRPRPTTQTAASQDDGSTDDDGNPYWFNPMTGESTYDQPGAQAEEWTQVYDDSGNVYWYNQATGASQYEDPYDQQQGAYDEGGGAMVQYDEYGQAVEPYYDQAQQYAEPDPNGDWAQYQDEAGNWYWYNQATGESTYDQPA
ncbi:hypothetical protein JL721_3737 [Aureococcus anophagefferens]|nr:hypothetical protein JL721_3737 [Aureococcus anophagefferens]